MLGESLSFLDAHNGLISALAAVLVAGFTYTLWRATMRLWRTSQEQGRLAERALTMVERAFISPRTQLLPVRDENNGIDLWRVFISLENNGNTQTRNLQWELSGGVDMNPDPESVEIRIVADEAGKGFLGPKSSMVIIDSVLTRSKITEIIKGRGAFYLVKVNYDDIFGEPHMTKFCVHVYGGPWKPDMPDSALEMLIDRFDLSFKMCRCNNCVDGDCQEFTRNG
jgi:hypothetical protein